MNIYDNYAKKDIDLKNYKVRVKNLENNVKDLEHEIKLLKQENDYRKYKVKELQNELTKKNKLLKYYKKRKETNSFKKLSIKA